MPAIVQEQIFPNKIAAVSGWEKPDYLDLFSMDVRNASDRSPEEWMRAALEQGAGLGGQVLWRAVLGLRLQPSNDAVAGWRVVDRGDRWIRLEADSWMMRAHVIAYIEQTRVYVSTQIRYEQLPAKLIWGVASVLHRRAVPHLLARAVEVLSHRTSLTSETA